LFVSRTPYKNVEFYVDLKNINFHGEKNAPLKIYSKIIGHFQGKVEKGKKP
jgi:hypothetical protein